jgi:hypothetical protein
MAPIVRLAAFACAVLVAGCDAPDSDPPAEPASSSAARPRLPVAEAPLDREALLVAVMRAASAAAAGQDSQQAQRALDGRRFELRLRFGCPNEDVAQGDTRIVRLDSERRVVRIEIGPEIERDTPLADETAGSEFEAVEGFWIRRPWMLDAACPRPAAQASAPGGTERPATDAAAPIDAANAEPRSQPAPHVGIAQFFTQTDARTHRRDGRAYQAADELEEGETPSSAGYDLIIQGRLQSLPGGTVISCRPNGARQPSCLISARFEQVSLERADTGELIAEWPRG